jgi:hypothetical protein
MANSFPSGSDQGPFGAEENPVFSAPLMCIRHVIIGGFHSGRYSLLQDLDYLQLKQTLVLGAFEEVLPK